MKAALNIPLPPAMAAAKQRVSRLPAALLRNFAVKLDAENQLTVGHIQQNKLSKRGPKTLGVGTKRGNRLRQSVTASQAIVGKGSVRSTIGTNVVYAAVHEFGFKGTVTVRQHTRKAPAFVFGHKSKQSTITVRSHKRQVDMPERAMFRSGIGDRQEDYADALTEAWTITIRN